MCKPTCLPTLRDALKAYGEAKAIKDSSRARYDSIFKTHFGDWLDQSVTALALNAFSTHCHKFAQSNGAAMVEVGRGVVGALIKYLNAVHGTHLVNPFIRLATAGLLPERAKPRERLLREAGMPAWRKAVDALPELQRDFLLLILFTGLRRDECRELRPRDIDFSTGIITILKTKNGKVHTLPITKAMSEILIRRCNGLLQDAQLFAGVSKDHVATMTMHLGAPRFMLHDLRKMLATTGEKLSLSDTTLRRILNHTVPKSDVLHKHYVSLEVTDIAEPLRLIQLSLMQMMIATDPTVTIKAVAQNAH